MANFREKKRILKDALNSLHFILYTTALQLENNAGHFKAAIKRKSIHKSGMSMRNFHLNNHVLVSKADFQEVLKAHLEIPLNSNELTIMLDYIEREKGSRINGFNFHTFITQPNLLAKAKTIKISYVAILCSLLESSEHMLSKYKANLEEIFRKESKQYKMLRFPE